MNRFDLKLLSSGARSEGGAPDPASLWTGGLDLTTLFAQGIAIVLAVGQALVILALGWMFARIVRALLVRALRRTPLDRHLSYFLSGGRQKSLAVDDMIGSVVYAILMLFVSIEVLQALGLTMVTEPLTALLGSVVAFLPRLFAAAALGLVAWGVATVARMMVARLVEFLHLGRRLQDATGDDDADSVAWTDTLADAVFYFVLLFFTPQILDALRMQGLSPVREMVGQILAIIPSMLGAVVVFFVFYVVAKIVRRLTLHSLSSLGVDRWPRQLGLGESDFSASLAASWVAFVAILFLGTVQAAKTLGLLLVAELAQGLLMGLFQVLISVLILAVGLWAGNAIESTLTPPEGAESGHAATLAGYAKTAVLIFAAAMALGQAGLASEIVHLAVGAVAFGAAIAGGLAFGLGGRDAAARWLDKGRQSSP